ncbi:MAG: GNAT family N-acetyltransferase [Gemmatimonadetes bacterium]|nr:GNAT family N-acetyltransferase [Gemmatimonadota bacterium]
MPDFPPLSPWLASVFVRPDRRGKGLGQALARRVLLEAAALGHARVYLFTTDQAGWYARMGWQVEQACASGGHPGVIMATDTARHGASF